MGKHTVLASANCVSIHIPSLPKPTHEAPPRLLPLITHAYRHRMYPALRGVLPCIKPTVKTVGLTTPAYPPRNAALSRRSKGAERHAETDAWRGGFTLRHAPL